MLAVSGSRRSLALSLSPSLPLSLFLSTLRPDRRAQLSAQIGIWSGLNDGSWRTGIEAGSTGQKKKGWRNAGVWRVTSTAPRDLRPQFYQTDWILFVLVAPVPVPLLLALPPLLVHAYTHTRTHIYASIQTRTRARARISLFFFPFLFLRLAPFHPVYLYVSLYMLSIQTKAIG